MTLYSVHLDKGEKTGFLHSPSVKKGKERREKKDDEVEGAGIADNRKEVCQESS